MEPTPSMWPEILQRASQLTRQYRGHPGAPNDSWSLVNRVWAKNAATEGQGPSGDHLVATWAVAMRNILRDIERRGLHPATPQYGVDEATPSREVESLPNLEVLPQALAELADREPGLSELIALKYFEDLALEEISSITGAERRAIRHQLTKARSWLRHRLGRTSRRSGET